MWYVLFSCTILLTAGLAVGSESLDTVSNEQGFLVANNKTTAYERLDANGYLKASLLQELKNIFIQEGIPPEYVCIAKIESNFDTMAVSSAGAAGIFQLMPDTARRFGLVVDEQTDERFDPFKSARAAARYLSFLKQYFNNWLLAIAAYNAGEGRVVRALQNTDSADIQTILEMLPEETQNYVPKVLAALNTVNSEDSLIK